MWSVTNEHGQHHNPLCTFTPTSATAIKNVTQLLNLSQQQTVGAFESQTQVWTSSSSSSKFINFGLQVLQLILEDHGLEFVLFGVAGLPLQGSVQLPDLGDFLAHFAHHILGVYIPARGHLDLFEH